MNKQKINTAISYEMAAFEEYYGSEFDSDVKLRGLDNHMYNVESIFMDLIKDGNKVEEIKRLIKAANKKYIDDIIEGKYWFIELPEDSPSLKSKRELARINYHKKFGWTQDVLKETDKKMKLLKNKKLMTYEYAYKTKEEKGEIPELDEGVKEQIAKHLRGSKKKMTKRKQNKTIYYFYMNGCPYCQEFDQTWAKLKKRKKDVKFIKYNKDNKSKLVKKYGIKAFPAIVRVVNNKHKLYPTDDREMNRLLKFIGR